MRFTLRDDRIVAIDVTGDAERISELDIVTFELTRGVTSLPPRTDMEVHTH